MTYKQSYNSLLFIVLISYFFCGFAAAAASDAVLAEPVRRAVLGINIANGRDIGGPVEGVIIVGVTPGGAAADAGLQVDDVVVEIDDVSLMASSAHDANQALLAFMADVSPGDELKIVYLRGGRANHATLIADELDPTLIVAPGSPFLRDLERFSRQFSRQFSEEFIEPLQYRWRHHGLFAGMELVAVTPALGRYFGTDHGLLVIRAPDNEAINLQDGDVIREIGGRKPQDPGHAMRILRSYEPGEEVIISIMRNQRDHDVAILIPASATDAGPAAG